jgi:hypothetical protein
MRTLCHCAYCSAPVFVEEDENADAETKEFSLAFRKVVACDSCAKSWGRRRHYLMKRKEEVKT